MTHRTGLLPLLLLLPTLFAADAAKGPPASEEEYSGLPNLVQNASFEMDWMHNKVSSYTRFLLLEQSDWGYAQSDAIPDSWVIRGDARRDESAAEFGKASLGLSGEASQVLYLCGETDPTDGGNGYNAFRPLPAELQKHVNDGPLRVGVWCKTEDAAAEPTLTVTVEYAKGEQVTPKTEAVTFGKGTHDWEYRELVLPPQPDLGLAHSAVVKVASGGEGRVWFDGALAEHAVGRDEPNLLPNGHFQFGTPDEFWPTSWGRDVLWSWSRREYYRFTGWSHENGSKRGGVRLLEEGRTDHRAMQMLVYPGDNVAVTSEPIVLNQDEARPLLVSAWVWADNARWVEVMATDENGQWLPQQDWSGFMGTDEHYRNRLHAAGTHGWEYVTKHIAPRQPVKELRLWLCARGIDGRLMNKNVVGIVIFDDVEVRERGSDAAALARRDVAVPPAPPPAPNKALVIPDPFPDDLGERLWGENEVVEVYDNSGNEAPSKFGSATSTLLTGPAGHQIDVAEWSLTLGPGVRARLVLPYRLGRMCPDWRQQYWAARRHWAFGTPPSPVTLRLGRLYGYPDEKLEVGVNLNITRKSLADEVASLRAVVKHPGGERVALETADVLKALWTPEDARPWLLTEGYVDARNLVALTIDPEGLLPVHPYTEPVRDCVVEVTLMDKAGNVIATQRSEPFGFMERPKLPELPERIEKTEVDAAGIMRVNGEPFFFRPFPTEKADLGGISRMLNFPKTHKILPLPFPQELVFPPDQDAAWKQKVQEFVAANKDDPKLFGYFFNHGGETSFWFDQWKEMAECQRKAAAWAREVDPNHLILSAEWLFGHGALKPETAEPFAFLDVTDVEPGLRWTPDSHAVRAAARNAPGGRTAAVVAGLETYYGQPTDLLRWRVYEALRLGASDVGICPSGMLSARPEAVSFLRGMYGETAGLEPMLLAPPPAQVTTCDNPAITLWERQDGKTRWVVAMRGGPTGGEAEGEPAEDGPPDNAADEGPEAITFTLPVAAERVEVMFEGRGLVTSTDGRSFGDGFDRPYAVHVYRVTER